MTNLTVSEVNSVLVVDSRLIAERLGVEHHNFLAVVEKHKTCAEQAFGILLFETEVKNGRGRPVRYALLTEDQATFFMTLSRNTPATIECKLELVIAFSAAKKQLSQKGVHSMPTLLPAEVVLQNAQRLVEHEQQLRALAEQQKLQEVKNETYEQRLAAHDAELTRSNNTHGRYYSICGYAAVLGIEMPYDRAIKMGKAASAMCRELRKPIGKVPDPRFGRVGTYPESILTQLPW